jgi:hypothetical protein
MEVPKISEILGAPTDTAVTSIDVSKIHFYDGQ